jgi:hypothetical protein
MSKTLDEVDKLQMELQEDEEQLQKSLSVITKKEDVQKAVHTKNQKVHLVFMYSYLPDTVGFIFRYKNSITTHIEPCQSISPGLTLP